MTDENIVANEAFSEGLRLGLEQSLGQTGFNAFGDGTVRRNLYEIFGWPRGDLDGWDEENWLALYLRNAYAKVVNDKPAFTSWRNDPIVHDTPTGTSDLERQVTKLARNKGLWNYAERIDRAAGIHQHGLLLISLSDVQGDTRQWREAATGEFESLDDVLGYKVILGSQIDDITWGGPESGRWGLPTEYNVDLDEDLDDETENNRDGYLHVHHSRVVDVPATRLLEGETLARPRCEPVLNNLLDIEKTLGAAAEAAYRGADYGLHINSDPTEVDFSEGADELREELERYENNLQRYIRTQGTEVNRLGGEISDPSGIIESNLDAVSAATGIPKKEFRGNETGEVAGAEADERSYVRTIEERQTKYCTAHIARPIIEQHQQLGILPTAVDGIFEIRWPDIRPLNDMERAELQAQRSNVVNAVPSLSGEMALRYVANGKEAFSFNDDMAEMDEEGTVDSENPQVRDEFERMMGTRDADAD